jgi:hypothetical protein
LEEAKSFYSLSNQKSKIKILLAWNNIEDLIVS